jgi:LPS-assembly lipoprotein
MWFCKASNASVSAIVVLLALATTGCGFQPIHGASRQGQARHILANIDIAPVDERVGQILYNRLLDRLNPKGPPIDPLFQLVTTLKENIEQVGFQKSEFSTRANLHLRASYSLRSLETGEALINNRGSVVATYNILRSDFATLASENEARRGAAQELADEIVNRLYLYFASNPAAARGASPP